MTGLRPDSPMLPRADLGDRPPRLCGLLTHRPAQTCAGRAGRATRRTRTLGTKPGAAEARGPPSIPSMPPRVDFPFLRPLARGLRPPGVRCLTRARNQDTGEAVLLKTTKQEARCFSGYLFCCW
jgi:hypothetical protein